MSHALRNQDQDQEKFKISDPFSTWILDSKTPVKGPTVGSANSANQVKPERFKAWITWFSWPCRTEFQKMLKYQKTFFGCKRPYKSVLGTYSRDLKKNPIVFFCRNFVRNLSISYFWVILNHIRLNFRHFISRPICNL